MPSQHDLDDAYDTLDRIEPGSCVFDAHERRTFLKLLWAYDASDSITEFIENIRLPMSDQLVNLYETMHYAYVVAWSRYGSNGLHQMTRTGWSYFYEDRWSVL